jgi:hypothetical protein
MTLLAVSTATDIAHCFLEAYSAAPCMAVHGFHEGIVCWGGNGTISGETSLVSEMDLADLVDVGVSSSLCVLPQFLLVPEPSILDHYTCLHRFHLKHLRIHQT